MNVEIRTEAAQFPEKEYINGFFLQCISVVSRNLMNYYVVRDGPAGADTPGEGEGGGQDEDVGAVQRGGEEQVHR